MLFHNDLPLIIILEKKIFLFYLLFNGSFLGGFWNRLLQNYFLLFLRFLIQYFFGFCRLYLIFDQSRRHDCRFPKNIISYRPFHNFFIFLFLLFFNNRFSMPRFIFFNKKSNFLLLLLFRFRLLWARIFIRWLNYLINANWLSKLIRRLNSFRLSHFDILIRLRSCLFSWSNSFVIFTQWQLQI